MDFVIQNNVLCEYKGPGGTVVIPEGVTEIGKSAFEGRWNLQSVTIPESVTKIGESAFEHCGLQDVTIPEGVTAIGESAFLDCERLKSVTIPESVTEIGEFAFKYCYSLKSVTIPESVEQIGNGAFGSCGTLTEITVDAKNLHFNTVDNVLYRGTALCCCPAGKRGPFVVEDGTTEIAPYSFYRCDDLESVTIPEGVTEIGDCAFWDCSGLQSVTIPESVTAIGESAFKRCYGLQSVTIPESVTKIGASAFSGCIRLHSVTIPKSVTAIGDSAFSGCYDLLIVTILADLPEIDDTIFQFSNPALIAAPHTPISGFASGKDKYGACIGFAKMYCDQLPLSEEIRAGYLAYIKNQRKFLYDKAMEYLPLLQLMAAEKMILPEEFEKLFKEALQKGNAELTALLLEYQHQNLKPVDWEREFELEEL